MTQAAAAFAKTKRITQERLEEDVINESNWQVEPENDKQDYLQAMLAQWAAARFGLERMTATVRPEVYRVPNDVDKALYTVEWIDEAAELALGGTPDQAIYLDFADPVWDIPLDEQLNFFLIGVLASPAYPADFEIVSDEEVVGCHLLPLIRESGGMDMPSGWITFTTEVLDDPTLEFGQMLVSLEEDGALACMPISLEAKDGVSTVLRDLTLRAAMHGAALLAGFAKRRLWVEERPDGTRIVSLPEKKEERD